MKFNELNFHPDVMKGIEEAGFEECMPVQEETFRYVLEGRDILAQSQTGTGKTAAFLISLYQMFQQEETQEKKKALIIVPTRELAVQIQAEAEILGKGLPYKAGSFYGGVGYGDQNKMLEEGVDIVIGTPGRLLDYNKNGKIDFRDFGFVVIDEADRLFDMGFLPDLQRIMKRLSPPDERRMLLYSATLRSRVRYLAWEYMKDPAEVEIAPEQITVEGISQELYHVGKTEKMPLLLGVLQRDKPENCLIFTNTRHMAWEVARRLEINGYRARFISGDLPQNKRLEVINSVKSGKEPILVATDVAARGLHIDDLDMVVNYDLPLDSENYVHRIGRTARAGNTGKAISLACESFVYGLQGIESYIDMKIPVVWADENLYGEDKSAKMSLRQEKRDRDRSGSRDDRGRHGRDRGGRDGGRNGGRRTDNRHSGGKRPSIGGERRPLDRRAAKVQSAITELTGSGFEGQEESGSRQGGGEQPRSSKGREGNRDQGRRDKGQSSRGRDGGGRNNRDGAGRSRDGGRPNRNKGTAPSPRRIDKNSTPEERLAYYKAKYGEDFEFKGKKGRGGSSSSSPSQPGKKSQGRKKSSQNQERKEAAPPVSNSAKDKEEKPKKGLFSKLFGKK